MSERLFQEFSEVAHSFDSKYEYDENFKQRLGVWTSLIEKYTSPGSLVYDVGCGSGILSLYCAKLGRRVVGYDGAHGMIAYCDRLKENNLELQLNFEKQQFPCETFSLEKADALISSSVLEYIAQIERTLEVFANAIKPGGIMMASLPNRKSIYRKLEILGFAMARKPNYLKDVVHILYPNEFSQMAESKGFQLLDTQFYGNRTTFGRLIQTMFGEEIASTLFVSVFQKKAN